jgi:hypothetical protein
MQTVFKNNTGIPEVLYNRYLEFDITFMFYPDNTGNAKILSDCNSISFVNKGTVNVTINGFPLNATDILQIDGSFGEKNTTIYQLAWTGTVKPIVWVIRKNYNG